MLGRGVSARPGRPPCAHLGAEALKHVPQDVGLSPGQHQLAGGLRRHMPVAQDQRALHFVYVVIAPVLGGVGAAGLNHTAPSSPCPASHTPHKRPPTQAPSLSGRRQGCQQHQRLNRPHQPRESPDLGSLGTMGQTKGLSREQGGSVKQEEAEQGLLRPWACSHLHTGVRVGPMHTAQP